MTQFVWLNDKLIPLADARVSVNDRGFQFGDGFFETLRAADGRVWFLAAHLNRLRASAAAFRLPFPEDLPWAERLRELLAANHLTRGTARVKILLSRGEAAGLGLSRECRPTLVIWAYPYEPPAAAEYARGWSVAVFPERRSAFLGRHKSTNYLFYLAARQFALDRGAREAIILETDGSVSEAAAASLIYQQEGRFFTPAAASALPGVTVAALTRGLARHGLGLAAVTTTIAQLQQSQSLWLANSLIGLLPVASIDGEPLPISSLNDFLQATLRAEAERPAA
jgi:branched-subunit amino acid aminotransferase/4-amino-4-deoxychorismate lyase